MPDEAGNSKLSRKKHPKSKVIGSWLIGRTIGKGSSGHVRIAKHVDTGEYAAVKIVSKRALLSSRMAMSAVSEEEDKVLLALEREIVIMKLIDHPNVLSLYDVWETKTELYLVMEYVQGGELFDYLVQKGRIPQSEGLHYFQQIIAAVDYCHRFNIAHRDLKPENLLLDADKNIKVADFGMAAWDGGDSLLETSCGSPHYASPEIVEGQAYHGSISDIWSCGVILYALLAGRLPFDDDNVRLLLEKVKAGKFNMPTDIEPAAQDLIRRMLEKDVSKRITMEGIREHPFYRSRPPRPVKGIFTPPPTLEDVGRPVSSKEQVDADIFSNMKTLWHGASDEQILEGLMNPEKTWEKAVYHLLVKYRARHLEDYNPGVHDEHESPSSRDKTTSRDHPQREVSEHAARPRAPTPRHANNILDDQIPVSPDERLRSDTLGPSPRPGSLILPRSHVRVPAPIPGPGLSQAAQYATASRRVSERSSSSTASPKPEGVTSLQPIVVPRFEDASLQFCLQQMADRLNFMPSRQPPVDGTSSIMNSPDLPALLAAFNLVSSVGGFRPLETAAPPPPTPVTPMADLGNLWHAEVNHTANEPLRPAKDSSPAPRSYGLGLSRDGIENPSKSTSRPPFRQNGSHPARPVPTSRKTSPVILSSGYAPSRARTASHGSGDSSDKENGGSRANAQGRFPGNRAPRSGPYYASDEHHVYEGESDLKPRTSLRSDKAPSRRSTLREKRVQIVEPVDDPEWTASKLHRRSIRETDSPLLSDGGFSQMSTPNLPETPDFRSMFPSVAMTQTPTQPKRSWFTTLFSFKPASYSLLSMYDTRVTRDECKRLLQSFNIVVVVQDSEGFGGGVLKCRLDEVRDPAGVMSVIKAVRFRVELHQGGGTSSHLAAGYITSLALVQEKGALSSFKLIFNRLRREWELDSPGAVYSRDAHGMPRAQPTLRLVSTTADGQHRQASFDSAGGTSRNDAPYYSPTVGAGGSRHVEGEYVA